MSASVLLGSTGAAQTIGAGLTRYSALLTGNTSWAPNTTEAGTQLTIRTAGTFSNLYIKITANATTANSTFRFRKNGGDGNMLLTIAGGATGEAEDTVNTDAVSAGDEWNLIGTAGSGGTLGPMRITAALFTADSNTVGIFGQANTEAFSTDSVTRYWTLGTNNQTDGSTAESQVHVNCPAAGTAKNLCLNVTANARGTNTVWRLRVNGSNGNIVITVAGGATGLAEDTSNTDSIAAGDLLNYTTLTSTGGGSLSWHCKLEFETTNHKCWLMQGNQGTHTVSASTTRYGALGGIAGNDATESNYAADIGVACTAAQLWTNVTANTASANSTVRLRKNAGDVTLLLTIAGGATGEAIDGSNLDVLAGTDEVDIQTICGSGGNLTFGQTSMLLHVHVTISGALSSSAAAAAAFIGSSTAAAVLSSNAVAAASFVGAATAEAVLAASAVASASFVSFGGSDFGGTFMARTDSNGYLVVRVLGPATASRPVPFGLQMSADADGYVRVKTEGSPGAAGPLTPIGNLLVAMDEDDEEVLVLGEAATGAPSSVTPLTPLGNLRAKCSADHILLCRVVGVLSGSAGPRQHIKNLRGVADENGYLCVVTES